MADHIEHACWWCGSLLMTATGMCGQCNKIRCHSCHSLTNLTGCCVKPGCKNECTVDHE